MAIVVSGFATRAAANRFMLEGLPGHFEPNDEDLGLWPLIRPPSDRPTLKVVA
jgi:hypothetical protein